jgi:thymidylate kinase/thymidylate synthase ThyX
MSPTQHQDKQDRGVFIVIEGTDGSGKGTQFKLLAEQLQQAGHEVALFDFPRYNEPSSYFVQRYLNGEYGSAEEVGPYTGSLFYALDRYDAAPAIREALAAGKVVLANRFTASNMGHQGTKFNNADQRRGFFIWLDNLEFETLQIPRPDLNIVLRVPAATAQKLVDQKTDRSYTDKKRDLHEADLSHLERAVDVYDDLCQLFPKDFSRIDCVRGGELLTIESINKLISETVLPLLPRPQHTAGNGVISTNVSPAATTGTPEIPPTKPASDKPKAASTAPVPSISQPAPAEPSSKQSNPYVTKQDGVTHLTAAGKTFLDTAVTDPEGKVYGFTDVFSPVTIAAAMARLSRRGDDMRVTLMDEFAHALGKDSQLLNRVITAYGDDSVQQLVGIPVVVEDASNLLTKKLEWGRLAAYLEQSTRYIYYDQQDAQGKYKYYTPEHFDQATTRAYNQAMDGIFERYSVMVHKLTDYVRENSTTPENERDGAWKGAIRAQACDAARAMLPVAVKSTVGIFASGQALEALIMRLMADELPEARTTGESLLREARKVVPAFLERADKPERGGAAIAYLANTRKAVRAIARERLAATHSPLTGTTTLNADGSLQTVTLTDVWPRNELDIVPDILYEHSDLPLQALRDEASTWNYDQKATVLEAYMGERLNRRHRPGRALEKIHYSWDLVCDYGIFRDLQRHRMVDDLEWQPLTPRLGYDTPKLVEDAGLDELFDECFDISLQLYSLLQKNGYTNESQYATLLGHRMRWKITYNAREAFHFHELRTSPQGHPGYRKLVQQMHEKLATIHPLLAEGMKFVNQGEDAELTRLAAERYTQFKLQQLDAA